MKITPYLTFDGQARDAFTLYQQVLGGELEMMTFAQAPDAGHFPAEHRDRIMHVCLSLGEFSLMASIPCPEIPLVAEDNTKALRVARSLCTPKASSRVNVYSQRFPRAGRS